MAELAVQTLSLLEEKLDDLEFLVHGLVLESATTAVPHQDALKNRLDRLEVELKTTIQQSPVAMDLLALKTQVPELFAPSLLQSTSEDDPLRAEKLAIVSASAPTYTSTLSQLHMLEPLPLPETTALLPLCMLTDRLSRAEAVHAMQAKTMEDLMVESAQILARWYAAAVMHEGETWRAWEERLMHIEQWVRREETAKTRLHDG